ncbi:hypothetical protein D3C86_1154140 [compost metagenome]
MVLYDVQTTEVCNLGQLNEVITRQQVNVELAHPTQRPWSSTQRVTVSVPYGNDLLVEVIVVKHVTVFSR